MHAGSSRSLLTRMLASSRRTSGMPFNQDTDLMFDPFDKAGRARFHHGWMTRVLGPKHAVSNMDVDRW